MTARPPLLFVIPSGTQPAKCSSCGQVIYWIKTTAGRNAPISVEYSGCYLPDRGDESTGNGLGINHFVDCPSREQHRKPKPEATR